ncbi:TPA: hypothetical protein ACH3X3_013388 [Trebouxia sp. C0006]
MPIRKHNQSLRPRCTISDSDSDDEICLNLVRYQEAELGPALHTRANYKRAVEELTALLRQAYVQHADKTIQELIFEDVLLAIRLCSRLECDRKAIIGLVEAAKQRLRQAKLRRVQQEYKQRLVTLSRKNKQSGLSEEDPDGVDTMLGELPLEVLQHMFSLLDPLTLGAVSCVSTTWHQLSEEESLWKRCLTQVAVDNATAQSKSAATYRQQFNTLASRSPKVLDLFRSNRVLKGGQLHWSAPASSTAKTSLRVFTETPLSVRMVVQHMLGMPITHMREQVGTDTDSDEEDLNNRINRLWRPSLQPLVKSYSHASM